MGLSTIKEYNVMGAAKAVADDRSSDRKVFIAVLTIAFMAAVMLLSYFLEPMGLVEHDSLVLTGISIAAAITIVIAIAVAAPLALREMNQRREAALTALRAQRQVELLFRMTDMLQSALGYPDANAVLRSTAANLLPDFGGALYVFNNSGDRLELSTVWAWPDDAAPADPISPSQCWALKRGKTHLNKPGHEALLCEHHGQASLVLEIPMMARGEVYGLLNIQASGDDAEARLLLATPVAVALSDAMSLALSNIALRDKLRTQALRDPLTGLYNRRYMEDVLQRYANLAERNDSPLSVIMIDLDHFKRLNDEHGHALGDAVLAEVASAIVGAIRPCDVACRYGGEELIVLLPDCAMAEGLAKAEMLRIRIERLSENHGAQISASFGVATIPDTSSKVADIVADADAALYRAKAEGRNRVVAAAGRSLRSVGRRSSSEAA